MKSETVLVTGATGFLGGHVLRYLAEQGMAATSLGRRPSENYRSLIADLRDSRMSLRQSYTTVFHLAGMAHRYPRNEADKRMFFAVNTEGTKNLLEALGRTDSLPHAVVMISTVAVYGLEEGSELTEEAPRRARDPYGESKLQAEDLLCKWCTAHGVRAAIIRLPLVAGKNPPGNLGAMIQALRSGRYFGIDSGAARRSIVLAEDVARVLPIAARLGGVFNLTDGHHPSFAELEGALCAALNRPAPVRIPYRLARRLAMAGDCVQRLSGWTTPFNSKTLIKMTSTLTMSDRKARRLLGWEPAPVLNFANELVSWSGHLTPNATRSE